MGQVVQLRSGISARTEIIEHLERMLAKARAGTLRGWMGVADVDGGRPQAIVCGTFIENPERAVKTAAKGLEALKDKTGLGKKNELLVHDVPARLRC
jgi:hypothetical protein